MASQLAYSEWVAEVRTYATCSVMGTNGNTKLNITQEYESVPYSESFSHLYTFLGTNFPSCNMTDKASLWWGKSIVFMHCAYSTRLMQNIRVNQTEHGLPGIRKGTLYFNPIDDILVTNMTELDFFECDFRCSVDRGSGPFDVVYTASYSKYQTYTTPSNLIAEEAFPNIWIEADVLAKAAYSTVLTDPGRVSAPSNMLTDGELLSDFTSSFSTAKRNLANAYPGPGVKPYGTEGTGPLGTTPSANTAKYLCQVPQRKSAGNLFVSVLVAGLVFLQALWFLFTFGMDALLLRRKSGKNHCEGCADVSAVAIPAYEPASYSRNISTVSPMKEDEMEMVGLRPTARGRNRDMVSSQSLSVSQQRLIEPRSMDIGRE